MSLLVTSILNAVRVEFLLFTHQEWCLYLSCNSTTPVAGVSVDPT